MSTAETALPRAAELFAALGDPTRLAILEQLGDGIARPIAALSAGRAMTRQAITKHLDALERAGLVHARRQGREKLFAGERDVLSEAQAHLSRISAEWDEALDRLRRLVEIEGV